MSFQVLSCLYRLEKQYMNKITHVPNVRVIFQHGYSVLLHRFSVLLQSAMQYAPGYNLKRKKKKRYAPHLSVSI